MQFAVGAKPKGVSSLLKNKNWIWKKKNCRVDRFELFIFVYVQCLGNALVIYATDHYCRTSLILE